MLGHQQFSEHSHLLLNQYNVQKATDFKDKTYSGQSVKTCNKKIKASINSPVLPNISDIDKEIYADAVEGGKIPCTACSKCKTFNKLEYLINQRMTFKLNIMDCEIQNDSHFMFT